MTLRDVYVFADTMIFKQQKGILFIINLKQDSKMSFTVQDIYQRNFIMATVSFITRVTAASTTFYVGNLTFELIVFGSSVDSNSVRLSLIH